MKKSGLRISGGTLRGQIIRPPTSVSFRPTQEKCRLSVFSIINSVLETGSFLDLFCGSGIVGIEAISRGCQKTCFVDSSSHNITQLKQNIEKLGISTNSQTICSDVLQVLPRLLTHNIYAVIYLDPPYNSTLVSSTLNLISSSQSEALILAEHHHKLVLPEAFGQIRCYRHIKQGETQISFWQKHTNYVVRD